MLRLLLLLPSLSLLFSGPLLADVAAQKGLTIAQEADRQDSGWKDQTTSMEMVLRNRQGDTSIRQVRTKTLEVQGDGDKSLSIFDSPPDVKGTAFLSFSHAIEPDDQWLFLPALKRVKRIASRNKSGPFMGSEFAYEDLSSQEVEKYTYRWLREESHEGRPVDVIERIPAYEYSGYTRQLVWMDKEMLQALKIEYYDRKNTLLKTLTQHEFKQYLGKYWRTSRMEMKNHQTGKSTTLHWSDYRFDNGLSDRDFNKNSLKRAR